MCRTLILSAQIARTLKIRYQLPHLYCRFQPLSTNFKMAKLDIKIPTLRLPDGPEIPMLGFGTGTAWYKKSSSDPTDQSLIDSIKTAISLGYTHLDGAEIYNTEPELGAAIKQSLSSGGKSRSDLFVTTKVSPNIEDIPAAIDASLKKLGLDYVDLYLIHEPFFANGDATRLQSAWRAMESVLASGKARSIGVSNFWKPELDAILATCSVRPAINQIEFHPYLQHVTDTVDLVEYHRNNNIRLAAYGPQLPVTKAAGQFPEFDAKIDELARKYAVSSGEILLRWVIDMGVVAVTTSGKEQRMSDYLRVCTFKLNSKEVEDIKELGRKHHFRGFWTHKIDANDHK